MIWKSALQCLFYEVKPWPHTIRLYTFPYSMVNQLYFWINDITKPIKLNATLNCVLLAETNLPADEESTSSGVSEPYDNHTTVEPAKSTGWKRSVVPYFFVAMVVFVAACVVTVVTYKRLQGRSYVIPWSDRYEPAWSLFRNTKLRELQVKNVSPKIKGTCYQLSLISVSS